MTTFKEIRGTTVESVSSDPSNPEAGQIWYNNTIGVLKGYQLSAAAWASGGNMGTARYGLASATNGSQTAALGSFGNTGPVLASVASESYNGSTWTATPNGNVAREALAGAGTQTAAVSFGGFYYPEYAPGGPGNKNNTEKFDGSSWTNSGVMNTGRRYLGGCGTQTAALAFGGNVLRASPDITSSTEEFNGSTWTNNPTGLNTARSSLAGAGIQTAALAFGGDPGTATESYDGSTWTTVSPLNTGRFGLAGAGTQASAIAMGGGPASTSTETWNGTSWVASTNMSTGRYGLGGAGSQTSAVVFGGAAPAKSATEEFTGAFLSTKKITTS
jgi:hypothetical protein